jgi:threonine synthase
MQSLYGGKVEAMRHDVVGFAYDDDRVTREIGQVYREHGYLLDPHSAIAWLALQEQLQQDREAYGVFLSTAHPAKFPEVVEPAIGRRLELPKVLADAIARPRHSVSMAAEYAELEAFLRS